MLYGEKMKQILEKFNVDTSVLPDSLYSTLLDAIYNVEISGEGGIDTSSATAIASDILKSKTAYAKGVKITGTIESKGAETYTPKTTDQTINNGVYLSGVQTIKGDTNLIADNIKKDVSIFGVTGTFDNEGIDTSDADALSSDIIKDKTAYVNGNKITGTIESKSGETYTPSTSEIVIPSGVYLSGNQVIEGDANLNSANIKKDVTIFGVTGTLDDSGIDTSDATATTNDILKDKTAYSNGVKVTGTIESKGEETYTPSTTDTVINSGVYLSGNQTIKGDVNLVADNIKNGVSIFGINGTMPEKIDTSDADATAEDIALGKTAYVNDVKITGTMESSGSDGIFEYVEGASGEFPSAFIKSVNIPEGATSLPSKIFQNFRNLTSVTIPNSVTEIGSYAFHNCSSLTDVTIPNSVTIINTYTFQNCTSLTRVKIPSGIITLAGYCFFQCTNLEIVVIPSSVTKISGSVFAKCTNLKEIYYSGSQANWNAIEKLSGWNTDMGSNVSGGTKIIYNYTG